MRRITDTEEQFIDKIVTESQVSFEYLLKDYIDKNIGFSAYPDTPLVQVQYDPKLYNEKVHDEKYFIKEYKKIISVLFLIEELGRENLVYCASVFDKDLGGKIKNNLGAFKEDGGFLMQILAPSTFVTEKLHKLINTQINSSPALEVYKGSCYRTEEQKSNDRAFHFGWYGIGLAFFGILASPFITNCYNQAEDYRKEKRTDFYHDEMLKQTERISDEIETIRKELTKPAQPIPSQGTTHKSQTSISK